MVRKVSGIGVLVSLFLVSSAWAKIGGGDVTFAVSGAGDVLYSHDIHVGKLGLKCSECHYRLFNPVAHSNQATMADMQKGQSCGACHNGQRAFDVKANCNRCHHQ